MSIYIMSHLAYFRVSTTDQSIESQRGALGGKFDKEFKDEGVSGSIPAAHRPAFAKLLQYVREGDTVHVYAVDRLGRDALDVQSTVRNLIERGVAVDVHGLGRIGKGVGELILAVLAQIADMERQRIVERTSAGRERAKQALTATGRTHRGKTSMGRPQGRVSGGTVSPAQVVQWREAQQASIAVTASHWKLSEATVKRYCATHRRAATGPRPDGHAAEAMSP
jgi:putative DNA-invertase from lambdoid prophage Rac